MSMLVAVFNQTTGWAGRTITYEEAERQFILQDHGPITAQGLLSYDALGQIDWAREGLGEWARELAEWESDSRPTTQAGGEPVEVADASPAESTMSEAENEPVCCPYCGVVLDSPPKATKKCPVCGEKIHLKRVAGTDARRLMTEADAAENDEAWGRFNLRKKAISASEAIGCSQETFLGAEQDLAARFGCAPGPGDVFWSLANHAVGEAGQQGDWWRVSIVYRDMARWLHEERGKNPFNLLRQASIAELRDWASKEALGPQAKVEVNDCNDADVCEACASLRGKRWSVAEALESPPVPHPDCVNGFCRCGLSAIPPGMEDEDL